MDQYDINDPTDIDIMRSTFDGYTADEWDEMLEDAAELKMSRKDVSMLRTALRKAQMGKYLSVKQIFYILKVVDKLDELLSEDEYEDEEEE